MLGQHVVVTLPSSSGKVIGIPGADTAEAAVTVTTAGTSAHLETVNSSARGKRLQTTRSGVQVSQQIAARVSLFRAGASILVADLASILAHLLLVGFVKLHHTSAGKVQGVGGGEKSKKTDLDGGVVEDLVLAAVGVL